MTDFYADAERSAGKFAKLTTKGATLKGTLLTEPEKRAQTFEGAPVLTRETREQRYEHLLRLQTALADDADDDGIRVYALKEQAFREFVAAWRKAGSPRPIVGATVEILCAQERSKPTEPDVLKFRITPAAPLPAAVDDDWV